MDEIKDLQPITLDDKITALREQIIDEDDPTKTKQLVSLFNWSLAKKNVARLQKLHNLYDSVTDNMVTRFENRSDQFSNGDLLDYMKVLQGAIDTTTKNINQTEEPPTIVNNTQINVNVVDGFDRDAKARILAAIQETLKTAEQTTSFDENPTVTAEFIDKTDATASADIKEEN